MATAKANEEEKTATGLSKILEDGKVVGKDGKEVSIKDLQKHDVVGFYFSAHWCGPCRRFTPMLGKAYENLRKQKADSFEIVFVSSDKDEAAFNSYYKESHPWKTLNWESQKKHKGRISKQLEAGNGIPSLVLVDAKTGETITNKGTDGFWGNESGKGFPFKPRSYEEIMTDNKAQFTDKAGKEYVSADLKKNFDYTMFYFSAHWCPPCRAFTPKLIEWYNNNKAKMPAGKTFELIFCSSDSTKDQYEEYYKEMPWCTFGFQDSRTDDLKKIWGINGIPSLQVVDNKTGEIAEPQGCGGRSGVTSDPKAEKFPWPKEPAGSLMAAIDNINEIPVLVVLAGKKDDKLMQALSELGAPVLKEMQDGKKKNMAIEFALDDGSTPDRLKTQLKRVFQLKDEDTLVLSDLGNGQFHKPKEAIPLDKIDKDVLAKFYEDFKQGNLETTKM